MHPAELPLSALSCSISISIKSRLKTQKLFPLYSLMLLYYIHTPGFVVILPTLRKLSFRNCH